MVSNKEFGRMVKSVERKGITLWCFSGQVEEQIMSNNEERRRSREAEGGRESWREVSKRDGRRVGNRPEACNFIKKETLAKVFSYEFCEISKNTPSYRTPPVAASGSYSMHNISACYYKL